MEDKTNFEIEYYNTLSSTNDFARNNLTHGRIIIAKYQTHGRGQREHIWQAEHDSGILATVVYELSQGKNLTSEKLSKKSAESIQNALKNMGLTAIIKQPNDILINNKKVCGILIEVINNFAIIGFGINVSGYPKGLGATSLEKEMAALNISAEIDKQSIILDIVNNFDTAFKEDSF